MVNKTHLQQDQARPPLLLFMFMSCVGLLLCIGLNFQHSLLHHLYKTQRCKLKENVVLEQHKIVIS